ncbi:MAG: ATP-dependent Clp protease ATP-binding subunit [Bacteroidaceae bacterium]|nr:ATP-dependent Clp protease ATP-binding subunit [Bacteroidaceae bacterium]
MENYLSEKAAVILIRSKEEADRLANGAISPEHILLGIMRDHDNRAFDLLTRLNVNLQDLKHELDEYLSSEDKHSENSENISFNHITITVETSKIFRISMLEARLLKVDVVDADHLLLAILRDNRSIASKMLQNQKIDYRKVFDLVTCKPDTRMGMGFTDEDEDDSNSSGGFSSQATNQSKATTTNRPGSRTPVLDNFSTDITLMAENGKLDAVVGREKEIERLAQVLSRRKKNNPVLIGEPGVGKTAIVEGLAERIIKRQVPRILFGKRVVSLDMASVVAGTKYRGQFEERLRSIISELKSNTDIILYIDEIHTIVGAGSTPGSMDAANMLKPALSRGELQCIGSTTTDEYRKTIEKDGALERRFQKIIVEPTTIKETLQILNAIKDKYEDHHNVTYTEEAIKACVSYSARYITDRNFPDKAIDVLDEAGSRTHLYNMSVPKEIEDKELQIEKIREDKNLAAKSQNFEAAANLRDQEKTMTAELDNMRHEWEETARLQREIVDVEQIANVVSMISGIPVQKIATEEGTRLKNLAPALKSKVIAQDDAIDTLVRAIQRGRVGLKNPDKPIGSFLFLGPTGVGKTLLAKELAFQMFGSVDSIIRIDMSEFMEKFTVSRLVGAPPGYVGYDEGGELTEKVRRKPYSIILLDEIEKANTDVFNILLQVMDEGRLTDSNGRTVDFRNTVIIMTSNIGSRQVREFGNGIGFSANSNTQNKMAQELIRRALNKSFAPEFLNRIDEIITFCQLDKKAAETIVKLELDQLAIRMNQLGYSVDFTDSARSFIATKGFDYEYGARPLKRAIQTLVEDCLSQKIIDGECVPGDRIIMDYREGDDLMSVKVNHPATV